MPQKRPLSASFCPRGWQTPGPRRRPPGAGVCAAAASLGTSHFFSELWHHVRLVLEVPFRSEKGALVLQRPPLSGTGNPLPGPPGTCLSVSLEGGAGAWAGRECGGPILTPALPRGAAGRSTRHQKHPSCHLAMHSFIHSFVHSPLTDVY